MLQNDVQSFYFNIFEDWLTGIDSSVFLLFSILVAVFFVCV